MKNSKQINNNNNNNKKLVTSEIFRSNNKELIIGSLNKINDWILTTNNIKDIEGLGIFKSLYQLIDKYNQQFQNEEEQEEYYLIQEQQQLSLINLEDNDLFEVIKVLLRFLKNLTVKETSVNETLRSLDYIHRVEFILNNSFDVDLLNDSSTVIECLRKCLPNSVRTVGVGEYSEENGQFQYSISMKQLTFQEVFVAWRVWESGIGFGKWLLENKKIFEGKEVLELGSGLGVLGFMAGLICKSVLMTDYTPKILSTLKENLKYNSSRIPEIKKACSVESLDWYKDKPKSFYYDIVIGSEVVYDEKNVDQLSNIIHQSLTPNGVFYSACACVRRGIPEFKKAMESRGYQVNLSIFPKRYVPDTKYETIFFECRRKK
ncbi:hypothetical protein DICPUDRAFT_33767 [Dictyostelium purpureum]|uniref:Uncharacterized protein n=1 Tax=Dictyostelium purpureum TaxID=5786 RepID=F0ZLF4_DICPU|nr:uncharacterized protein DICPUDRAFT_33767 [Dictyostelium purpureum]EGC35226.1 hypothetical protein DICPUDRAFT_33767 [Dictyostelium purpureum]|eukprot:XP_003288264.1 hypothetical protein DICPUDRAFT_33767 [Dictyostelium purpureum]